MAFLRREVACLRWYWSAGDSELAHGCSAKRMTNQMAISMDWTATILAAANTPAGPRHALDGTDLLPIIKGASPVHDRTFFWRIYDQDAVRQGKWKYARTGTQRQLFDLSVDQREK